MKAKRRRYIKAPPPPDPCTARVGGEEAWLRRERPDGSTYSLRIIVGGRPCGDPSVTTFHRGGKPIRRCIAHLND